MTDDPTDRSPAGAPERPSRAVRVRRRVARTVVVLDVIVLFVTLMRLGFVEIGDHPGLATTVWVAVAVFLVAFPFVGFRDGSPGNR